MSEEIIKVLDELGKRFGVVIDWSNQNIIPYLQDLVQRFITYRNCLAIIQIVISVIVIIIGIVLIVKMIKWSKNDEVFLCGIALGIIFIGVGIGLIIGNTVGIIQNVCMPEITIIEYIKEFN